MQQIYADHGLRFHYPDDWELYEQQVDQQIDITVESPETSFWSVILFSSRPEPREVVEQAVAAFRDEYEEMDVYPAEEMVVSGHRAIVRDLQFVSKDLINSAFLRAFRTGRFTVLILYQGTDHELKDTQSTLEAMTDSLRCEFGDDVVIS